MTLSHQTWTLTRSAAAAAGGILESDPKIVSSGEKEKEYDGNSENIQKRDKVIVTRIGRPLKLPPHNEDEYYKEKEE